MAVKRDSYISALGEIVVNLENVYNMNATVNGIKLQDSPIVDIVAYYNSKLKEYSNEQLNNLKKAAGTAVVPLSYLTLRMRYYNKKRLDFSKYPNMKAVAKILITLTKAGNLNSSTVREVNKIIALLEAIDRKYVKYRNALAYRYLRIFIIMFMHGNYVNAFVVADFIINQFIIREDLR